MNVRKLSIAAGLVVLLSAGGWYGWYRYTTPSLPEIALEGADKPMIDAIEEARQDVRQHPRSGASWGKLGKVLAVNGFREPSFLCFAHAARFDPANPRWPYLHGVELAKVEPRQGMDYLRKALDLAQKPDERAAILFRMAYLLMVEGQLDQAQPLLQQLRDIEPEGSRTRFGLGLLAFSGGNYAQAREQLGKLTEDPFFRKQALVLLSSMGNGSDEQALKYRQTIARLPADIPWPDPFVGEMALYIVNRSDRLEEYWKLDRQGRQQEAIALLRQLVADSPDTGSCFTLGFALYKQGELHEAAEMLRAAIGYDSRNARSHYILGACLLGLGEQCQRESTGSERAVELFRQAVAAEDQAIALQSNLGYAHMIRGRALGHLGQAEESLQALQQAVLCQPESAEVHESLGVALAAAGKVKEAIPHLENAVRLANPNDPRPRALLEKWRALANP